MPKQGEYEMFECLIYYDFVNTTPSRNFGSNARGGVLEYCRSLPRNITGPYLSLIFLFTYIVSSPLSLVIYGSEPRVGSTQLIHRTGCCILREEHHPQELDRQVRGAKYRRPQHRRCSPDSFYQRELL